MSRKHKKLLFRIIFSALLFTAALLVKTEGYIKLILFAVPYLAIGWDVLYKALRNLFGRDVLNENLLMSIATIGAFVLGEYPEGVAVMLFYQVGDLFEKISVDRSRKSIASLMDLRPDYAVIEENGEPKKVSPYDVNPGDIITVKAGEKIPLDGDISDGSTTIDTSSLTGESVPLSVKVGDSVLSGSINLSSPVKIKVTKPFTESTVTKILELVENAESKKAKTENFITVFARYYTPAVVSLALLLAFIPPLLLGGALSEWVRRALIFLVISCPCALVISVPLSFFSGIGGASKCGILIKGGNFIEALSKVETVVFDKTGTLTKGIFRVSEVTPSGSTSREELIEAAALAESYSDHPVSKPIIEEYGKKFELSRVQSHEELSGMGVSAVVDGKLILAGNERIMTENNINIVPANKFGTVIYVARDNAFLGSIVISDEVKPDSVSAVQKLKNTGIKKTVMLTGDRKEAAEYIARTIGLDEFHSSLLPADKVEKVEELLAEKNRKGTLIYIGDGINDAPVLTRADVGIAMGGLGRDAAIEASDVVIMDDNINKVEKAISISKKTLKIVKQNIAFAIGIKILVMIIGALGYATMWEAVFADVGVSVIAILNSLRAMRTK